MKRYLLFGFSYWYPNGGMNDLEETFDNWSEIDAYYEENGVYYGDSAGEYQVFDILERKIYDYPSKREDMYERINEDL